MFKRIVKLGISVLVFTCDQLVDGIRKLVGLDPKKRCVVLYYHGVSKAERSRFETQMSMLARKVRPVPCDVRDVNGFRRCAAVTFDDGFNSVVENALPVLSSENIPSTIFIPTGYLGSDPLWITNGELQARKETVMSNEELKRIVAHKLVTIGSHSITHKKISDLPEEAAFNELKESKNTLETILGMPVSVFSFPHGSFSSRDLELAKRAGYKRVFGTQPMLAFINNDEFLVGRVAVNPSDWLLEFRLKLAGAYRWETWVSPK